MSLVDWVRLNPAMSHLTDDCGIILAVSDTWLAKLGFTRTEVVGRAAREFMAASCRSDVSEGAHQQLLTRERLVDLELQLSRKDGMLVDVLVSYRAVEQGGQRLTISNFTDITELRGVERRLADSETKYRHIVEYQDELVSVSDVNGVLLFLNRAYAEHHGTTSDELVGVCLYDLVPAHARSELEQHMLKVSTSGKTRDIENEVFSPDGKWRWISWTNKAVKDEAGRTVAIHSVGKNIDARVEAETKLRESEQRYRLLAENSSDMVFELTPASIFSYASPACFDILGHPPAEVQGRSLYDFVLMEEIDAVRAVFNALQVGDLERHTGVYRFVHRDGHPIWVELQTKTLSEPSGKREAMVVGTIRDFGVHKRMEEKLRDANLLLAEEAATDVLTGLMNRRAFDTEYAEAFSHANQCGGDLIVILVDVDYFKSYNDIYGHSAGDECLRIVSAALRSVGEEAGGQIARYGGEEFCIILAEKSENMAYLIADRMRGAVEALNAAHLGSQTGVVTISLGLASLKQTMCRDRAELLNAADRALYRAKASGRNTVHRASHGERDPDLLLASPKRRVPHR